MSLATKENIKRLLDLTGMTHEQLAKVAGVTRSTVTHWVRGGSEPRMGPIQRMADYFHLNEHNITDVNGMKYVSRGPDGRLRDDNDARMSELRDLFSSLDKSDSNGMFYLYTVTKGTEKRIVSLSEEESILFDMYRSLNDSGRKMAFEMVAALVKSGNFSV